MDLSVPIFNRYEPLVGRFERHELATVKDTLSVLVQALVVHGGSTTIDQFWNVFGFLNCTLGRATSGSGNGTWMPFSKINGL